jgi:hypothetical protein
MCPFTMSTPKILLDGWKGYAEKKDITKTEPMENFDWMDSSIAYDYNDCRDALGKVDRARDWLKAYTNTYPPFSCEMAVSIPLGSHHSGASAMSIFSSYRYLLNNWDTFVFATKKESALSEYKKKIPCISVYYSIVGNCSAYMNEGASETSPLYEEILNELSKYVEPETMTSIREMGPKGVPWIHSTLAPLLDELKDIYAAEQKVRDDKKHRELIGCLEFHYKWPVRWFDSKAGSSLCPGHPSTISTKALDDMEVKYPGYRDHIYKVSNAIELLRNMCNGFAEAPYTYGMNRAADAVFIDTYMKSQGIVAGNSVDCV